MVPECRVGSKLAVKPKTVVVAMVLIAFLLFSGALGQNALVAPEHPMLCQSTEAKSIWRLPERLDRQVVITDPTSKPLKTDVMLYKRNHIQYRSEAWKCQKIKQTVETFTYFFDDEHLKKEQKEDIPIDADEFYSMKEMKKCREGSMVHG